MISGDEQKPLKCLSNFGDTLNGILCSFYFPSLYSISSPLAIRATEPFNDKLRALVFLNKVDTNPKIELPYEASNLAKEFKHLVFKDSRFI